MRDPDYVIGPDDLFLKAVEYHRSGRLNDAATGYRDVLRAAPDRAPAIYLLGVIAYQTGHFEPAAGLIRRALAIQPRVAEWHNTLGLALMRLGNYDQAGTSFERAIELEDSPEFHNNIGILRKEQGRLQDALAAFHRAIELNAGFANAHYNLGNALRAAGDLEQAVKDFRQAVCINAGHAHAFAALGQSLHMLKRFEEAASAFQRAVALLPEDASLRCDFGDTLEALGGTEDAAAQFEHASRLEPGLARAWYSRGCFENSRKDYAAAIACFRRALKINPEWPEAQHNLGHALFQLGQVDEALRLFEQAALTRPELPGAMIAVIIPGSPKSGNQAVLEARRAFAQRSLPEPRPARHEAARHERMRIGYVSSFFHCHNWMKPVWGLINQHDRGQFEVHLFSDAPASGIEHGYRFNSADRFHDITNLSNADAADLIEAAGIDLLIDLNGYSSIRRLPLFALRLAPAVIAWFNMFATTGMSTYDCLIGDREVIPPEEERFYSERIVCVPGTYLTFEVTYPTPPVTSLPRLTNAGVTFGSLAPQYKVTPEVIAAWSAILREVPGSILVLKNRELGTAGARDFVRDIFSQNGAAAERLRLYGPSEHYQFLETYGEIDLALDTFPYNGGTTTTEAIWQGVPVVTFRGDRWVSRTSASILRAAGLGEFVARDLAGYIELAVSCAVRTDLAILRANMRPRLLASAACDTRTFARNMERIYRKLIR